MDQSDDVRRRTAVHEAGHAVMACVLGLRFAAVSIEANQSHGFSGCLIWDDGQPLSAPIQIDLSAHEPYILTLAAGYVAECEVFGALGEGDVIGALHDMGQIATIAAEVIPTDGDAMAYVRGISNRVADELHRRRSSLEAVADRLLQEGRLTRADVSDLVGVHGEGVSPT